MSHFKPISGILDLYMNIPLSMDGSHIVPRFGFGNYLKFLVFSLKKHVLKYPHGIILFNGTNHWTSVFIGNCPQWKTICMGLSSLTIGSLVQILNPRVFSSLVCHMLHYISYNTMTPDLEAEYRYISSDLLPVGGKKQSK